MDVERLAQPLALVGLVIATELYYLLIRRRRQAADEQAARISDESLRRGIRRLRRLRRYDEEP